MPSSTQLAGLVARTIVARLAGKTICPAKHSDTLANYPITTDYGIPGPWQAGHHTGEDHSCPIGSLAIATTWGSVIHAGSAASSWGSPYGEIVVIRTASGHYDYGLCHLSQVKVRIGQKVQPGQVVGLTGDTGNTTGPHLHFECRPAGGSYGSDVKPIHVKRRPS